MMLTDSVQNGIGAGAATKLGGVALAAQVTDISAADIRARCPIGVSAETLIRVLRSCVAIALRMQDNCPMEELRQKSL